MEMTPQIDIRFEKFRKVLSGPDSDLFSKILDNFYDRLEEEYDEEPFTPEQLQFIEEAEAAIKRGDMSRFFTLEEFDRELGL